MVDYYMPGCPPESHQIAAVIDLVIQALQGKAQLPPKGSVIGAGPPTVCDECPRSAMRRRSRSSAHPID
jgi:F420-non-reducing hydrogenase small subunit